MPNHQHSHFLGFTCWAALGHMQSLDEKDVVKLDGLWDVGPGIWTPVAQGETGSESNPPT